MGAGGFEIHLSLALNHPSHPIDVAETQILDIQ